jgi:hypothetical protein
MTNPKAKDAFNKFIDFPLCGSSKLAQTEGPINEVSFENCFRRGAGFFAAPIEALRKAREKEFIASLCARYAGKDFGCRTRSSLLRQPTG